MTILPHVVIEWKKVFEEENDKVILQAKNKTWKKFFENVSPMSEDFMDERLDFFQPERGRP